MKSGFKTAAWKSPDEKTVAQHLDEHVPDDIIVKMLVEGGIRYASMDMKTGISVEGLVLNAPLLAGPLELDPRGGYYLQGDIVSFLRLKFNKKEISPIAEKASMTLLISSEELLKTQAYLYRVMLSHLREKATQYDKLDAADAIARTHPQELKTLYAAITIPKAKPDQPTPSPAKKNLHPFVHFRQQSEDQDTEGQPDLADDDVCEVYK